MMVAEALEDLKQHTKAIKLMRGDNSENTKKWVGELSRIGKHPIIADPPRTERGDQNQQECDTVLVVLSLPQDSEEAYQEMMPIEKKSLTTLRSHFLRCLLPKVLTPDIRHVVFVGDFLSGAVRKFVKKNQYATPKFWFIGKTCRNTFLTPKITFPDGNISIRLKTHNFANRTPQYADAPLEHLLPNGQFILTEHRSFELPNAKGSNRRLEHNETSSSDGQAANPRPEAERISELQEGPEAQPAQDLPSDPKILDYIGMMIAKIEAMPNLPSLVDCQRPSFDETQEVEGITDAAITERYCPPPSENAHQKNPEQEAISPKKTKAKHRVIPF